MEVVVEAPSCGSACVNGASADMEKQASLAGSPAESTYLTSVWNFYSFIWGPSSVWMNVWTRPAISGVAVGLVFRAVNYPDCRVRVFFTRREAPPPAALLRFRNLKKTQHVLSGRIRESNGAFLEEVSFMLLVYFYFWDMVSRRNRSLEKNVRVGASLRALRLAPLRK